MKQRTTSNEKDAPKTKKRHKVVTTETRMKMVSLPENWTISEDHVIYDTDTGFRVACIKYCSCDCNWCDCGIKEEGCPIAEHVCLLTKEKFFRSTKNRMRLPKDRGQIAPPS